MNTSTKLKTAFSLVALMMAGNAYALPYDVSLIMGAANPEMPFVREVVKNHVALVPGNSVEDFSTGVAYFAWPEPTSAPGVHVEASAVRAWPDGAETRLEYYVEQHSQFDLGSLRELGRGWLRLAATLDVHATANSAGTSLDVTFVDVESAGIGIAGAEQLAPDAVVALEGTSFVIELSPDGLVRGVRTAPDAPQGLALFARSIAIGLQLRAGSGHEWSGVEDAELGASMAHYVVVDHGTQIAVDRTRQAPAGTDPQQFHDEGAIVLDAQGIPSSIDSVTTRRESVHGTLHDDRIVLSVRSREGVLARSATLAANDWPLLALRPEDMRTPEERRHARLLARSDGLTQEALVGAILEAREGVALEGGGELARRASGLLAIDRDARQAMREVFLDPRTTSRQRALTLDMLVSCGTSDCGEVLVDLVRSATFREGPDAARLVQHVAFFPGASPALVGAVRSLHEASTGSTHDSSSYALASLASRLPDARHAERDAVTQLLESELDRSADVAGQEHGLRALGNLGSGHAPSRPIRRGLASSEPRVRRAAVAAARALPEQEGHELLMTVARSDADPGVRSEALRELGAAGISDSDLGLLAQSTDRTPGESRALIALASRSETRDPATMAALGAALTPTADPRTRAQLDGLAELARMGL